MTVRLQSPYKGQNIGTLYTGPDEDALVASGGASMVATVGAGTGPKSGVNPMALAAQGRRNPYLAVTWGDSRAAQCYADPSANSRRAGHSLAMANAMAGSRLTIGASYGFSGDRTDQALARVAAVIASGATYVHVFAGVNDHAQQYPSATTSGDTSATNLIAACEMFRAAGMTAIVELEMGANSLNAAMNVQRAIQNARLYDYAESVAGGVYLHDAQRVVMDPNYSETVVQFRTGYSDDGTHENGRGAFYHAKSLQQLLTSIVPPRYGQQLGGRGDKYGSGGYQVLENNTFVTATGGTANTGVTGSVPNFWTADTTGSATISSTPAPDGLGNNLSIVFTATAADQRFRLFQSPPGSSSRYNIGDYLEVVGDYAVTEATTALKGVQAEVEVSVDGLSQYSADLYPLNGDGPDDVYSVIAHGRPKLVTGAAKSFLVGRLQITASRAGTIKVTVRSLAVRRRSIAPL